MARTLAQMAIRAAPIMRTSDLRVIVATVHPDTPGYDAAADELAARLA